MAGRHTFTEPAGPLIISGIDDNNLEHFAAGPTSGRFIISKTLDEDFQ
jgi:hypothetical protein